MNTEQLRRLHGIEISILDELDRICRKNSLTYYLVAGTLLGAVRHGGFIPWDDDIDVAMPRQDFEELCKIAPAELSGDYELHTSYNEEAYFQIFAKICKKNTAFIERDYELQGITRGISLDIFPLDSGKEKPFFIIKTKKFIAKKVKANIRARALKENIPLKHKLFLFIPRMSLVRFRDRLIAGKGGYYINYGSQYNVRKQTMGKSVYDPPARLLFENKEYPVPGNYEYFLKRLYGENYMQLPPAEKRVTHNPVRLSFDTSGPDEVLEA